MKTQTIALQTLAHPGGGWINKGEPIPEDIAEGQVQTWAAKGHVGPAPVKGKEKAPGA